MEHRATAFRCRRLLGITGTVCLLVFPVLLGRQAPSGTPAAPTPSLPVIAQPTAEDSTSGQHRLDKPAALERPSALCEEVGTSSGDGERASVSLEPQHPPRDENYANITEALSWSSSPEHLYVAALFERDAAEQVELLSRAVNTAPTDAFLMWSIFDTCSKSESAACPMESWERRLIEVDGGNSEAWRRIAVHRFLSGDRTGALDAMQQAATSAESRIYQYETIAAIERGLAAAGPYTFRERVEVAVGVEAAIARYSDLIAMCRDMTTEAAEWAYACLRYGQLLEKQGKAEISSGIALWVQKMALESLGDTRALAAVEQRVQARRQIYETERGEYDAVINYLFETRPELFFYTYLSAARTEGELAARRRIRLKVAQMLKEQPELSCIPDEYRITVQK